jgi:hypothetical protein
MKIAAIVIGTGLMLASTSAFAKCDRYGNCYSGSGGSSYGYNPNTGSSWNSRSSGNSTYGTDSSGNSYQYNRQSGQYYNYGTGETRTRGQKW